MTLFNGFIEWFETNSSFFLDATNFNLDAAMQVWKTLKNKF